MILSYALLLKRHFWNIWSSLKFEYRHLHLMTLTHRRWCHQNFNNGILVTYGKVNFCLISKVYHFYFLRYQGWVESTSAHSWSCAVTYEKYPVLNRVKHWSQYKSSNCYLMILYFFNPKIRLTLRSLARFKNVIFTNKCFKLLFELIIFQENDEHLGNRWIHYALI